MVSCQITKPKQPPKPYILYYKIINDHHSHTPHINSQINTPTNSKIFQKTQNQNTIIVAIDIKNHPKKNKSRFPSSTIAVSLSTNQEIKNPDHNHHLRTIFGNQISRGRKPKPNRQNPEIKNPSPDLEIKKNPSFFLSIEINQDAALVLRSSFLSGAVDSVCSSCQKLESFRTNHGRSMEGIEHLYA